MINYYYKAISEQICGEAWCVCKSCIFKFRADYVAFEIYYAYTPLTINFYSRFLQYPKFSSKLSLASVYKTLSASSSPLSNNTNH